MFAHSYGTFRLNSTLESGKLIVWAVARDGRHAGVQHAVERESRVQFIDLAAGIAMRRVLASIVSADGDILYLDGALNAVAQDGPYEPLRPILGAGDADLEVPTSGRRIELPGSHEGFSVERIEDGPHKYRFRIAPSGVTISINTTFIDRDEQAHSQSVVGMAYLGIGGIALLTDEMELHCAFGPSLDGQRSFDLGYYSSENLRAYSSKNACDHIKSFRCRKGNYYLLDDLNYVLIFNPWDFPGRMQGKPEPQSLRLYNADADEVVGCMMEPFEPYDPPADLVRIPRGFRNVQPLDMSNSTYIFQGVQSGIKVFEIYRAGTGQDKIVEVKKMAVKGGETDVRLVQL